ncbi:MAG: hypothetical protein WCF10_17540 [Polyangiales bacterium]
MTRFAKLMMLGVLAGTVGVVGCGSSSTPGPSGGTGGSGGSGGTGGTAGTGGTGGSVELACGEGESIDSSFTTGEGSVACDALGVINVPIGVVLAAKPMGDVSPSAATDFEVQVQFTIDADTVATLGGLVQTAEIGESSADVDDSTGGGSVNVPATVPCTVDFSVPGAIVVTTPVQAGAWTAADGAVVLEATDMTFAITQPVPLTLSTKEKSPGVPGDCTWATVPTVTFNVPAP